MTADRLAVRSTKPLAGPGGPLAMPPARRPGSPGRSGERWVSCVRPVPDPLLRLVCVPYAGGGAATFHGWAERLPPAVEQWTLRLPGRDARRDEPAGTDLLAVAGEAAAALAGRLTGPFAVFGHSLGGFLAYELVRALREVWGVEASLLAVGARMAPHLTAHHSSVHTLDDEAFLDVLAERYRGIPPTIREHPQMRRLYLPMLRADVTMLETYRHRAGPQLACPVVAYGGVEDGETTHAGFAAWGELTDGGHTVTLLPGDHFFLHSERDRLVATLSGELLRALVP
ncbi:thioesterase II family protein [Streptomyces sp. MAR4 CNY-716]